MSKELLLKHFQAGDTARFAKAWVPTDRTFGNPARSWLGWLTRDEAQREDKQPGDLIAGGIKRMGAPDAQVGAFLEIVMGTQRELLAEGAFPAWVRLAKTTPEAKARAKRAMTLLDQAIPGMSRGDASKLLGVYLRADLRQVQRKAFLAELTPEHLARWNSKSLLRPEYLLEHDGWGMDGRSTAEQAIALIDTTLDRLGDIPRFVRVDVIPADLVKLGQGHNTSPEQLKASAHLLSRLMPFFKPETQQQIQGAMRTPQLDTYRRNPTPAGLQALANNNPTLSFDTKRSYDSISRATLGAYAKALLVDGVNGNQAGAWRTTIDALTPAGRQAICADLADAIEDVVEHALPRHQKIDLPLAAGKMRPVVQALRALSPDAPLAARSWAELALTGALLEGAEPVVATRPPKPARR